MSLPKLLEKPAIMGILNITPDSFSDGGHFLGVESAVSQARRMAAEGAAIVDIGGESTRPGAIPVTLEEELARITPVFDSLGGSFDAALSIDTTKVEVAEASVERGAAMVNDISALRFSPDIAGLCADRGSYLCLVHMQGTPQDMQKEPRYTDVVSEVKSFLSERVEFAMREGVSEAQIVVDPGIGFGKTVEHNLELLGRIDELVELGLPVLVGVSRKGFLGELTGRQLIDRVDATVAANVMAYMKGAHLFRVHDVGEHADAFKVVAAADRASR